MSCLGQCYVPNPPRAWNRVQNQCSYPSTNTNPNSQVFVPLLTFTISTWNWNPS